MDAEGVAEGGGVEVVFLSTYVGAGVVGEMEGVADVDAENEHVHVVMEADAGSDGYIVENVFELESTAGAGGVGMHQPDVAGVDEKGVI